MSAKDDAIQAYAQLLSPMNTGFTFDHFVGQIKHLIESGQTSWDEVGFSESDFNYRVLRAKGGTASEYFELLKDNRYQSDTLDGFATYIIRFVESGAATWESLGFTRDDVLRRLGQTKREKTTA
jgi:hypothetical protein